MESKLIENFPNDSSETEMKEAEGGKLSSQFFDIILSSNSCSNQTLGLTSTQEKDLDQGKILSLFENDKDNLAHFIGLWKTVKEFGNNCMCDPRDERKRNHIGSWRPLVSQSVPLDKENEYELPDGIFPTKQTVFEEEKQAEDRLRSRKEIFGKEETKSFHCGVHGCGKVLSSLVSYESHYHRCHSFTCGSCGRVFVSNFLLDIHLQENHDSYFAVLSPRIDMYRCLVESCDNKFRTPELRKDHLVTTHKFPTNFSFHQPIKEKLRCKPSKESSNSSKKREHQSEMETSRHSCVAESDLATMDTTSPSSVPCNRAKSEKGNGPNSREKKVPASISFGRGVHRAFYQGRGRGNKGRNWYQTKGAQETETKVDIETVDMMELGDALTS